MMVSSGRPMTVLPLSLTSFGIIASCCVVTRSIANAFLAFDLLREIPHHSQRRIRRRLPQAADRSVHHGLGKLFQQRLVPLAFFHQGERLRGADSAGGALAAGL